MQSYSGKRSWNIGFTETSRPYTRTHLHLYMHTHTHAHSHTLVSTRGAYTHNVFDLLTIVCFIELLMV